MCVPTVCFIPVIYNIFNNIIITYYRYSYIIIIIIINCIYGSDYNTSIIRIFITIASVFKPTVPVKYLKTFANSVKRSSAVNTSAGLFLYRA